MELNPINLKMEEHQVLNLTMHLYDFLLESAESSKILMRRKFELIDEILLATLGYRKSLFGGLRKSPPYFDNSVLKNLNGLKILTSKLSKISFSNNQLDKTYKYLSGITNFGLESHYLSIPDLNKRNWDNLVLRYIKMGVNKTKDDFEDIIHELTMKHCSL